MSAFTAEQALQQLAKVGASAVLNHAATATAAEQVRRAAGGGARSVPRLNAPRARRPTP